MILADLIGQAVADPRWCGGLSREHLARLVKRHPYQDGLFKAALFYAYRQGKVDFCLGYIVQPPTVRAVGQAGVHRRQSCHDGCLSVPYGYGVVVKPPEPERKRRSRTERYAPGPGQEVFV